MIIRLQGKSLKDWIRNQVGNDIGRHRSNIKPIKKAELFTAPPIMKEEVFLFLFVKQSANNHFSGTKFCNRRLKKIDAYKESQV